MVTRVVQEPAEVRVIEAADARAVRIAIAIGVLVMVDVMAGPPERALLHGGDTDRRPEQAGRPVHLERAVRVVAVIRERQSHAAQEMRRGPEREI